MSESLTVKVNELTDRVLQIWNKNKDKKERIIISVSGAPGSGKTTLTKLVCEDLNRKLGKNTVVVLPQDGFHYYLSQLAQMPDPNEKLKRRGAPFTFDSKKLLELVKQVKYNLSDILYAPDFDHKTKDPTEKAITIGPEVKIILLEGNYIQLKDPIWNSISDYVNDKWTVKSNLDEIKERIIRRHIAAEICSSYQEAEKQVEGNDLINAQYVIENSQTPDLIIQN